MTEEKQVVGLIREEIDTIWIGMRVRNFITKVLGWLLGEKQGPWGKMWFLLFIFLLVQ